MLAGLKDSLDNWAQILISSSGPAEVLWDGDEVNTPPPPLGCEQTENITFRHPSDADGKNANPHLILSHCYKWYERSLSRMAQIEQ